MPSDALVLSIPHVLMIIVLLFGWVAPLFFLKRHRRPMVLVLCAVTILTFFYLIDLADLLVELREVQALDWFFALRHQQPTMHWFAAIYQGMHAAALGLLLAAAFVGRSQD